MRRAQGLFYGYQVDSKGADVYLLGRVFGRSVLIIIAINRGVGFFDIAGCVIMLQRGITVFNAVGVAACKCT